MEKIENIPNKINEIRILDKPDDSYSIEEFENIINKIGVSVILIAHQKTGLDISISKHSHHSLSECVENPEEWIKTGYINALEYQKPKVQGILKNNLRELRRKFATITGSDCHVWSAYPYKDETQKESNNYVTKIKCLPTFKGLVFALTSPDTRFDRKDEGNISNYIDTIKIDNTEYKLSTGINAIIGENGAGKSFLLKRLNNDNPVCYKKLLENNDVKVSKTGEPQMIIINQGEIIEKVKKGNLLDNDPALMLYRNMSKRKYMKATRNPENTEIQEKYQDWKEKARNRYEKYKSNKMTKEQFLKWLEENEF